MKQHKIDKWVITVTTDQNNEGAIILPKYVHGGRIINADKCVPHQTEADGIFSNNPTHVIGSSGIFTIIKQKSPF